MYNPAQIEFMVWVTKLVLIREDIKMILKDYKLSDKIRNTLETQGVSLQDRIDGGTIIRYGILSRGRPIFWTSRPIYS